MLQKTYELQINHLFWPEGYLPEPQQAPLSHLVRRFLMSRLKRVHLYDTGQPTVEIRSSPKVNELVEKSLEQLPGAAQNPGLVSRSRETHRRIPVEEFLDLMNCFEVAR